MSNNEYKCIKVNKDIFIYTTFEKKDNCECYIIFLNKTTIKQDRKI